MSLNEMSLDTPQYCMEHTQEEPLSRSATGMRTNHDAKYDVTTTTTWYDCRQRYGMKQYL